MTTPQLLTIAYLQQKLPKWGNEPSLYTDLFQALAQSIGVEMQLYNTVPVKCSVASEREITFIDVDEEKRNVFALQSKDSSLRIFYDADRSFDHLLCELCFGGTGIPEPDEEGVRPQSKFERRFRANVLCKLLGALPMIAKRTLSADLEVALDNVENGPALTERLAGQAGLEVVLQLNAFSFTSEIKLQFLTSELAANFLKYHTSSQEGPTAMDVLGNCFFSFEARLKPREIALREIVSLQPGQVISLEIEVTDPLVLSCENKPVFYTDLKLEGPKVRLELLAEFEYGSQKLQNAA